MWAIQRVIATAIREIVSHQNNLYGHRNKRSICLDLTLRINQREHYIGKTLTGEYVALKTNDNDELNLYYGPVYLGKINNKGLERPKNKSRRQR